MSNDKPKKLFAPATEATQAFAMPEIDEIDIDQTASKRTVQDDKGDFAIKMAFIGSGQGGCNIAAKFHAMGYGKVIGVNTTHQDFKDLVLPYKYVFEGEGGAGKNPEKGKAAILKYREEVMSLLRTAFGDQVEQIVVCIGSGGGTGSGSCLELVELAKDYLKSLGHQDVDKAVGVLAALPKASEGVEVNANAYKVVTELCRMATEGKLSPLVLIDNMRIGKLYPKVSVKDFYDVANKNIAAHFDIFNRLAAQPSNYATFDVADYRTVLRSGILLFGHTRITTFEKESDISDCIRQNLSKGLFCEGFDLKTANIAAGVLVASDATLGILPESHIDLAFTTLNRLLSEQRTVIHRGIYETNRDQLFLYTIIGGLGEPVPRLTEMKRLGGLE